MRVFLLIAILACIPGCIPTGKWINKPPHTKIKFGLIGAEIIASKIESDILLGTVDDYKRYNDAEINTIVGIFFRRDF